MKRIILAAILLFVSAALLATSSFAWFSMNTTVSVHNVQITAKSNSVFLLISETNTTAATIQAEKKTSITHTISAADSQVYPSAYEVTDGADFATVSNWYTANSDDPASSTMVASTKTALVSFDEYVIRHTYYLTVAAGSNTATNLIVSAYSIEMNNTANGENETITPVKAVVVCGSAYEEFDSTSTAGSVTLYTGNITDSTVVRVDIYVYYDGNDTNVFTNNIANLEGATIGFEFSVSLA